MREIHCRLQYPQMRSLTPSRERMRRCVGGYAVVVLVHNVGVLAFLDPWGLDPMVFGERKSRTLEND